MATPFPYRSQKTTTERLRPVKADDEGSEGKIPRWGWMSDGKLRPIERGLPILDSLPTILDPKTDSMRPLMTFLVDKPYLKDFNRTYGALAARHPEYDLNDPDMMSHYEKQLIAQYSADPNAGRSTDLKVRMPGETKSSTKIPLDAHLHTWGGAIPYLESDIFPDDEDANESKRVVKKKPKTGIYGDQNVNAEDETAIIRSVHFRTLNDAEVKEQGPASDNATMPLVFGTTGRRDRLLGPLSEVTGTGKKSTVQKCLKKFFDPEVGIPFVPANVGKYFPMELLIPEENSTATSAQEEMEQELSFVAPGDDTDTKSMLLDTRDQDVLFTKNKAPFTRQEISALRAFGQHWDNLKIRQREREMEAMKQRRSMIKQAFHNKEVFETYLKLMDEDCKRIRSGVLGRSPYKNKSLWQVAIEKAPMDHNRLEDRRRFWWRFCAFVRFIGGLSEQIEKDFVKLLRVKLMLRHPVDASLFWDLVNDVSPAVLESVATLRLIEFCRIALEVGQQAFNNFLDEKKISPMIYNQTILNNLSKEYMDKVNQLAKGPMEVPPSD